MSAEALYLAAFALVILEKIVCFVLGYLTIKLGHNLLIAGVKGEFKFAAKLGGVKTDLASVSPGLLFVLLGVMLICFTVFVDKDAILIKPGSSAKDIPELVNPGALGNPFSKNKEESPP